MLCRLWSLDGCSSPLVVCFAGQSSVPRPSTATRMVGLNAGVHLACGLWTAISGLSRTTTGVLDVHSRLKTRLLAAICVSKFADYSENLCATARPSIAPKRTQITGIHYT